MMHSYQSHRKSIKIDAFLSIASKSVKIDAFLSIASKVSKIDAFLSIASKSVKSMHSNKKHAYVTAPKTPNSHHLVWGHWRGFYPWAPAPGRGGTPFQCTTGGAGRRASLSPRYGGSPSDEFCTEIESRNKNHLYEGTRRENFIILFYFFFFEGLYFQENFIGKTSILKTR